MLGCCMDGSRCQLNFHINLKEFFEFMRSFSEFSLPARKIAITVEIQLEVFGNGDNCSGIYGDALSEAR